MQTEEIKRKLEYYCAYQERCHSEVITKLFQLKIPSDTHDEIIVHLIHNNFLNEERFALSYASGKNRLKGWGKKRIKLELELRKVSTYLIQKALNEIDEELYINTFNDLFDKKWNNTQEQDTWKKNKKVLDYFYRKGYDLELITEQIKKYSNQL